jgi:hypothetical protein
MHPVISLIRNSARSGASQCVVHYDVAARPHKRRGMTESAKTRHDTAIAKYFEGKTLHQIAANLGLARITIARWLRKW